jgi:hypothetical protein
MTIAALSRRLMAWVPALCVACFAAYAPPATAQTSQDAAANALPSNPQKNAYFGELHVHTAYSIDSYVWGNANDPEAAYKFGRGGEITLPDGEVVKRKVPLDFMAVTDHAETLGDVEVCTDQASEVYNTTYCQRVRKRDVGIFFETKDAVSADHPKRPAAICGETGERCVAAAPILWRNEQKFAASYYEPGKFTTLFAFEFSPMAPQNGQLHRNVIFRTSTVPDTVFSAYEGSGEDLMKWLDDKCKEPCRVLTIPHNSNYSWGRFFWQKNSDGTAWTRDILDRRARIEPLIEITQVKGTSECQVGVGLSDEECNYGIVLPPCKPGQELWCAQPNSFVRDGIVAGLGVADKWGVNPFKYGFVGASDSHLAMPGGTPEKDYHGWNGQTVTPDQRLGLKPSQQGQDPDGPPADSQTLHFSPGGLTGVWAEKNTRETIWDALYRRETFGTSGTRIRVRFFGSFGFPADLHKNADMVKIGYAQGVPMGGDLTAAPAGKAPRFVVWATRDPDSAPLQKIQVIKGWVENGQSMVKIYDVVCSDGINADPKTGACADNGAAVDTATCTLPQGKGAGELSTTWTDPGFDPKLRAVYYVRVLEDPTCRWSTYDAHRLKVKLPDTVPLTAKERAWTSPIWYTPGS